MPIAFRNSTVGYEEEIRNLINVRYVVILAILNIVNMTSSYLVYYSDPSLRSSTLMIFDGLFSQLNTFGFLHE